MRLKCHKCGHGWDDSVDPGEAVVMCPDCMAIVPMALATAGEPTSAPASPPPPPPARSAEAPRPLSLRPPPREAPPRPQPAPPPRPAADPGDGEEDLACNKCPHKWREKVDPGEAFVQCPKCMAIVPTMVARQSKPKAFGSVGGDDLERTVIERPSRAPIPAGDDLERTVIERPAPPSGDRARIGRPVGSDADLDRTVIERPAARSAPAPTPAPAGEATVPDFAQVERTLVDPAPQAPPKARLATRPARPATPPPSEPDEPAPAPPQAPLAARPVRPAAEPPPAAPGRAKLGGTRDAGAGRSAAPRDPQPAPASAPAPADYWAFLDEGGAGPSAVSERTEPAANPLDDLSFHDLGATKGASAPPPSAAAPFDMSFHDLSAGGGGSEDRTIPSGFPPVGADSEERTMVSAGPPEALSSPAPASRRPRLAGADDRTVTGDPGMMGGNPILAGDAGDPLVGATVGGLVFEKKLGQGGMGAVYLARQISLDRHVAVKVLPEKFAKNPDLLARFTREALSAAQLNHHNVVQVYDVGSDAGRQYIVMEFVRGRNLGDMVREDGKLDLDSAVAYVLQAARGLKYAHERGVVHRDIKPDNLMLNEHGVVKIADMGLAKIRGEADPKMPARRDPTLLAKARADLTAFDIAMGTPAYMPPEQARDAASADDRADQYSLGCTLFYLCTGRAPFSGTTAMEIISRHMSDNPPRLDEIIGSRVPDTLQRIIARMLEKDPDERYGDMGDVIQDLEAFLGVDTEKGAYAIQERQLEELEIAHANYYSASALKTRRYVGAGFAAALPLAVAAIALSGNYLWAAGLAGLMFLVPATCLLLDGLLDKTVLFRRIRSVFFGMTWRGWVATLGSAMVATLAFLSFRPVSYLWLGFALLAAVLALARRKLVLQPLRRQRAPALEAMNDLLRKLRLRGVSEDALQNFVYRYSGDHWEEFFEEIFGYGPMILARTRWAALDQVKPRKRHAVWREPLMRALDQVEEARRRRRETAQLEKVEAERLRSKGMNAKDARKKARELADQAVEGGLLQTTVTQARKKIEADEIKFKEGSKRSSRARPAGLGRTALQLVRLALGIGMMAAWGLNDAGIFSIAAPEGFAAALDALYSHYGLVAGALVFVTAFSVGNVMPYAVVLGALLLIGAEPLTRTLGIAQFDRQTAFVVSLALMGGGFGMCLLNKLTGGKF